MLRPGVAALVAALALLAPPVAGATRYAVGLKDGVDAEAVRLELERRTETPVESLAPVPAFVVDAPSAAAFARIAGVRYVERLRARRLAFTPTDPYVNRQWYLAQNRSYDAWLEPPPLAPVRVAVIDSGVDRDHPDLAPRIAAAQTFVDGAVDADVQGHGTFVAGIIGAQLNNQIGIAGLAPAVDLLIAKVVSPQRTIPVEAEAKAIRWAVQSRARVINMSLGGLRDPTDASRDTFSRLEADAIAYAVSKGVVVVAAVGNGDQAPAQPWPYASYPAALPHVLGVSAVARDGSSPSFSNRDPIYNDIAAPGEDILSTFPRALTAAHDTCPEQGYSSCGPEEYRNAEGTSFAAPQVSAAAAALLAVRPTLQPNQVISILERTAVDVSPANGCKVCPLGRDKYTGWGRLDVAAALASLDGVLPAVDRFEPNDDAGTAAFTLWGAKLRVSATVDFWDDQNDVYRVFLRQGQRLYASLSGPAAAALVVWRPGTVAVDDLGRQDLRATRSTRSGSTKFVSYRARERGWHFVQVKLGAPGSGAYRLRVEKR